MRGRVGIRSRQRRRTIADAGHAISPRSLADADAANSPAIARHHAPPGHITNALVFDVRVITIVIAVRVSAIAQAQTEPKSRAAKAAAPKSTATKATAAKAVAAAAKTATSTTATGQRRCAGRSQ